MWRLLSTAVRERNANSSTIALNSVFNNGRRGTLPSSVRNFSAAAASSPDVAVQLDYYMSLQFAGVACALVNGT